ncbi:hypothetical protein Ahy_B09g096953 isoform F [Arachis hypogaea]|uniref:Auxin-induced protein n=1 Tax=Arachis hypogaea TaxID=3818 RepID=A0A444XN07_ARAHY|nr:hypothetical protein Ahy_B09g096953 isoform F [Arachis hypogaea]
MINFEETELRLGLPGGSNDGESSLRSTCTTTGKRGFSETTPSTVDLKLNLNLSSSSCSSSLNNESVSASSVNVDKNKEKNGGAAAPTSTPPKSNKEEVEKPATTTVGQTATATSAATSGNGGAYVKVSVDGAPYLRKVDLKQYKSYRELSDALAKMFSGTMIEPAVSGPHHEFKGNGLFSFNGSDYVPTYEDKDADWMLVGDVPWE